MFRTIKLLPLLLLFAIFQCLACEEAMLSSVDESNLTETKQAIINGKEVTGNDMLSTVAIEIVGDGVFCTGTLISPNYVLTAAHCVSNCKGDTIESSRRHMRVLIGQDYEDDIREVYEIEAFYPHHFFICNKHEILNDIAVLKLKAPVPSTIARPTPPMPPMHDLTLDEAKAGGVSLLTAGFGRTGTSIYLPTGKKYQTFVDLYAMCSMTRGKTVRCDKRDTPSEGFYYFNSSRTGTCSGDSGGPTFMTRHGIQYVVGVTSFGVDSCMGISASTMVSDHYDFILDHATDIFAPIPEICDNGIDDSANTLIDCADPACADALFCVPEICDNGIDDNGDTLVDCADPDCADARICASEICDNGIDDNGDTLVDCADPDCADALACVPEICDNGFDDNGDTLVDCADPDCADALACVPEICDNGIDDNGDTLVDCADPDCADALVCVPEICDNGIDDNGDGFIDCTDPACADSPLCVMTKDGGPSSCSAMPRGLPRNGGLWAMLFVLVFLYRRRLNLVKTTSTT